MGSKTDGDEIPRYNCKPHPDPSPVLRTNLPQVPILRRRSTQPAENHEVFTFQEMGMVAREASMETMMATTMKMPT